MKQLKNRLSLCIILLFSFLSFSCNHLLYPASRESYLDKKYIKPKPPMDLFIPVGDLGEKIHAWYFETQAKDKKGTVVHFHGNGQNLTTHFLFFLWVTQMGFDYYIFDYRGYGQSDGEQAAQQKTVEDGLAILRYVQSRSEKIPLIAIGQSLGSNVLVRTLQELSPNEQPDMVVFDSSFISYKAAARSTLKQKWFLYPLIPLTYLAISDEWSGNQKLDQNPNVPALFFHGGSDLMIRQELGEDNFKNWKGPKVFVTDQEGQHTSAFGDNRFMNKNKEIFLKCFEKIKNPIEFMACL